MINEFCKAKITLHVITKYSGVKLKIHNGYKSHDPVTHIDLDQLNALKKKSKKEGKRIKKR